MTTFTINGHHILFHEDEAGAETTTISPTSISIITGSNPASFSYGVLGADHEVPGLLQIGLHGELARFDDGSQSYAQLPLRDYFITELTTPQGVSVVFGWWTDDGPAGSSSDTYFVLNGPAVSPNTWLDAWDAVSAGDTSQYDFAAPQGAFAPGQQIGWDSFIDHAATTRDIFVGTTISEVFDGGTGNDKILGKDGDDTLGGGSGRDRLDGGTGDDVLLGHGGNDRMRGGKGSDQLKGGNGNDRLEGSAGRDMLEGGRGNDLLLGGSNGDRFVFANGFGQDTIGDFNLSARREKIDLEAVSGIRNFRDLRKNHLSENEDGDAVISDSRGNSITLEDIAMADLSANDFIF